MAQRLHRVPSFLRARGTHHRARASERATDHRAVLVDTRWECDGLRRLTFACAAVDHRWRLGDRILITVDGNRRRTYTVCGLNRHAGRFDVLAVAHEHGPGGRMVGQLLEGEPITLFGPQPDLDVQTRGATEVVLLGDETTLGLFEAVRLELRGKPRIRGAVEYGLHVPLHDSGLSLLDHVDAMVRDERHPGARLLEWVRQHAQPDPRTVFFVNGHGAAVRALRLELIRLGVRGAAIRSRAYWGRG